MTNASASSPRIRSARIRATTICSTKSRRVSFFFGASSVFEGLALVVACVVVAEVIGDGPRNTTRAEATPSLTNVPDFPRIGNPARPHAERAHAHGPARDMDDQGLPDQRTRRHDGAPAPEPRVVR